MRATFTSFFVLIGLGCSAESPATPPTANAGSTGLAGAGASSVGGSISGASGASSGGAPTGGAGAGALAGAAGGGASGASLGGGAGGASGTSSGGGSGGAAGGAQQPIYECSQLMGPNVAGEWFDAGFQDAVGDARWQVKAPHHAFVDDWADPAHDVWLESSCQGTYTGCETRSRCANDKPPDRLLFVTQTGDYLGASQAAWQTLIQAALDTAKVKYPALLRVELLTFVRGPNGENCGGETTVAPALDAAQQAVAAASKGFVGVGPHLMATTCAEFSGSPHMTAAGNAEIARQLAGYYDVAP